MKTQKFTIIGLQSFSDKSNNKIIYSGVKTNIRITFHGNNNTILVDDEFDSNILTIECYGDNNLLTLGHCRFKGFLRLSGGAKIDIGDGVTCTDKCFIDASEGATVKIGNDCMFATANQIRTNDAHAIYDVRTGERINPAAKIHIGNHVWVGFGAKILAGTTIGDGSVVGMDSIVKGKFPNNCIIAGVPAELKKKNIAWERAILFNIDSDLNSRSLEYWNLTEDLDF